MQINSIKSSKETNESSLAILSPTVALEDAAQEVNGKDRDENGPHTLWQGLAMYSGKHTKKKEKPKPQAAPTETERLADILTRYGNNPESIPTLHYAILQNDIPAVELLLKHGASPMTKDHRNFTCLYYAVKVGSIPLIQKFLSLGLKIEFIDDHVHGYGLPSLFGMKQVEIAKYLIAKKQFTPDHMSPLVHWIARGSYDLAFEQRKDLIRLMVEHGASINGDVSPEGSLIANVRQSYPPNDTRMEEFLKSLGAR